jgi:lipopolysaccharide biosynthesis protein
MQMWSRIQAARLRRGGFRALARGGLTAFFSQGPQGLRRYLAPGRAQSGTDTAQDNSATSQPSPVPPAPGEMRGIAVVVHVFYPELWPELAAYLENIPDAFDLYVSTVASHADEVTAAVAGGYPQARVVVRPNRGRDMGPFLYLLQEFGLERYPLICKLHTKKSPHRNDGDAWRNDLYARLMGSRDTVRNIVRRFAEEPQLGLLGPAGHLAHYRFYWGANRRRVRKLCDRLGIGLDGLDFEFVAGSMFWCRGAALRKVRDLAITLDEFEAEDGQLDGTLAHAMERVLPLAAFAGGFHTLATDSAQGACNPRRVAATRSLRDYLFFR